MLIPNRKEEIETEGTQSNRERVVVSPHGSRVALGQGHQQFQSIHWYWVRSQQNVLIPERQGGKGAETWGEKKVKRYTSKKLILKIHHFPFPNFITTMEIQGCLKLYKATNQTHLETVF